MKQKLTIITITLIILAITVMCFILFSKNSDKKENNESSNTQIDSDSNSTFDNECKEILKEILVGTWTYPYSSEINFQPSIHLKNHSNFQISDKSFSSDNAEGTWEFNNNKQSIKLTFNNYQNTWVDVLKSDLSKHDGVVDYSYEDKYIELKIQNFAKLEKGEFTGCDKQYFFINFLNNFLYRELEDSI